MDVTKKIKQNQLASKSVREKLALATCALVSHSSAAQEPLATNDWVLDLSLLNYAEKAGRITVNKLIANAQGQINDGNRLNFDFVYDSMTGATPTGAIPIMIGGESPAQPVVITSASGGEPRGISSGGSIAREVVQLADFEDERFGINAAWQHDYTRLLRTSYAFSFSDENDFTSTGVSVELEVDDQQKLQTYTFGVAYTDDAISRVNTNLRVPLSSIQMVEELSAEEKRSTHDLILGYVRVLNKRTLLQLNTTFSDSDGYQTDPYKNISVIDAAGMEIDRLYEARPAARQRSTLLAQMIYHAAWGDDVRASYRYYADDWGIDAHTLEVNYRYHLSNGHYFEPVIRHYSQTEADFYFRALLENAPLPRFASSDSRLADMSSRSVGLKYGFPLQSGGSVRLRLESYDQSFDNAVIDDNRAIIFQLSYKKVL